MANSSIVVKKENLEWQIGARLGLFDFRLKELWLYRDLLFRFVRRDLLMSYQQTLLGPVWIFLQPVLTTLVYYIVFGRIVKVSTGGIPPVLFYLSGIIVWNFFSDCLNGSMYTFVQNATLFRKVYFPRLIVPLSATISHTIRMAVQLVLFIIIYFFYRQYNSFDISASLLLLPLLIFFTALFGLGFGLMVSVLTSKYRDLDYALQFVLRLYMFATPIVYPAAVVPADLKLLFWLNPLTGLVESFRAIFFQSGVLPVTYLLYSISISVVVFIVGLIMFQKNEQYVIDTV